MMSPDALLSYPLRTWQERCCAEVGNPSAGFAYLDRMSEVEEGIGRLWESSYPSTSALRSLVI